jgi:hypothetical protein
MATCDKSNRPLIAGGNGGPQRSSVGELERGSLASSTSYSIEDSDVVMWFMGQKDTPQGVLFCVGIGLFIIGYIFKIIGLHAWDSHEMFQYFLNGLCQTVGLLLMTIADIDANAYLRRKPKRVALFASLLSLTVAVYACTPPQPASEVYWLEIIPLVYLVIHFKAVCAMEAHLKFTEVFISFLIICELAEVLYNIANNMASPRNPIWPQWVLVLWQTLTALAVGAAYKLAISRGESLTLAVNYGIYCYLLMLGVEYVMHASFEREIYGKPVTWAHLTFGWMHLVPAALMLIFRKWINGYLGRHWLRQRLRLQGTSAQFTSAEGGRGTLEEVENAMTTGEHINGYFPKARDGLGGSDRFTLLLYAAGNGRIDAVEMLLDLDIVAVNFASKRKGYSPLYLARYQKSLLPCACACLPACLLSSPPACLPAVLPSFIPSLLLSRHLISLIAPIPPHTHTAVMDTRRL